MTGGKEGRVKEESQGLREEWSEEEGKELRMNARRETGYSE